MGREALTLLSAGSSSGSKASGVDGKTWSTNQQKIQGIFALKQSGYKPQPLRRIHIPKRSSSQKLRPLAIPTMIDRAQQALHLLGLEPVMEE